MAVKIKMPKVDLAVVAKRLEKDLPKDLEVLGEVLAERFIARLKKNMRSNKYGFKLAASTIQARLAKGNTSTRPLIDTKEYINSIKREMTVVFVQNINHKGSGIPMEELSSILEYGRRDKSIPPFPIWSMTFEEIREEAKEEIAKILKKY